MESDAIPVVRSCLDTRRKALERSLLQYQNRLSALENQHRMTSEEFATKFDSGKLGDSAEWFEWEFLLGTYHETKRQLGLLASIKI